MSDSGASLQEQLLEAARRDNVELLGLILKQTPDKDTLAELINNTHDPLANTALHICAKYGSFEVMDTLLDQEGVEVDPVNGLEGETPLHLAVKYAYDEPEHGTYVVETLLDAGADPRVKNSNGLKPVQLVRNNDALTAALENAEYALAVEDEQPEQPDDGEQDDESASDSD